MIRCCLVDTTYPINPRNDKIIQSLKQSFGNMDIKIITWNRNGDAPSGLDNYYFYDRNARMGDRIKKFFCLFGFKRYVSNTIRIIKPNLIIASHWDALFSLPVSCHKTACVVYDNIDVPDGSYWAIKFGTVLERSSLRKVDIITHASRFFPQLFEGYPQKQLILENKPMFPMGKIQELQIHNPFIVSFIGTIRYFETISKLVDAIRDDSRFELHFYGNGPDLEMLQTYCKEFNNVKFYGKYQYEEVQKFYLESDLIWAVYPNKDYNVKYAISNKFYESMYLGVPCVYADKTELGDLVERARIGYTVNPYDSNEVKKVLEKALNDKNTYSVIINNIREFANKETNWDTDFNEFTNSITKCFNSRLKDE